MDASQLFIAFVLIALIGLLVWGRYPVASVFSAAAFLFFITGLINFATLSQQLINPGLVTVVLLMLVASVLDKVRLLETWTHKIVQGPYRWALLKLIALVGVHSAFLNNTAVVASLIGPLRAACKGQAPRLLLPLSYAATLGGMMTLIGTSTNLLVGGFVVGAGLPALSLFAPLSLGIFLFGACALVMVLLYPYLLKEAETAEPAREDYLIEAVVTADSPLVGRTVENNGLNTMEALQLAEIVRPEQLIAPVRPQQMVRAGDVLVFAGDVSRLDLLAQFQGLEIDGHVDGVPTNNLLEVMVSGESVLVNKRLRNVDFRTQFDAALVAVRPARARFDSRPELMRGKQPERLLAGDLLVLAVGRDFQSRNNLVRNFIPVSRPIVSKFSKPWKGTLALTAFLATILGAALGWFPFINGLICLLVTFLATGLVRAGELRRSVPWQLIFTIGSALVVSQVLTSSGLAELMASSALSALGDDPRLAIIVVLLMTALLTEMMTNNAAAALMFPIALSASITLDVGYMPFVMAVIYGASASFLTPHGYQTNLMVMSPGGYRPLDYLRAGFPISLVYLSLAAWLIPAFFTF